MTCRIWFLVALLSAWQLVYASDPSVHQTCTPQVAQFVEEKIDEVTTWEHLIAFHMKYEACDKPALSDAFTQKMAELAALPDGIVVLWSATEHQRQYRQSVARRIQSESITSETREAILSNLELRCPQSANNFCRDLRLAIQRRYPKNSLKTD